MSEVLGAGAVAAEEARSVAATRGASWAPLALGAIAASMVAARLETVLAAVVVAGVSCAWLRASSPRAAWTRMLAVGMLLAIALNLYLVRGRALPLPLVFGAPASVEGLERGALLALRLLGAALSLRALAAMWPGERAADELAGRLRPLHRIGVPVDELRGVFALALRFVPLLQKEGDRIGRVQALRAGRPPRGAWERLTRLKAALVPTLVAALERAEQVALALEARHHRTRAARVTPWSWAAQLAGAALFLMAMLWRN